jgi:hypothetical protein
MFGCCYLAMGSSDTHLMNMRIEENGNVVSNKSTIIRLKSTKQKKRAVHHARKNGLFSAKVGAKMTSLFAMHTM